jgi:hypothetical protein
MPGLDQEGEEASDFNYWGDVYNLWRQRSQIWLQTGVGGPTVGYIIYYDYKPPRVSLWRQ